MSWKSAWGLLTQTVSQWSDDKAPQLGAALAYYSVFSIAPLVILAVALAGLVFGEQAARGAIAEEIGNTVGHEVGEAIQKTVQNASSPASGVLATLVSVAMLLFGASGAFGQLQDSLNTIWKVKPRPGRGLWGIIQDRFLSFAVVLGTGFLLLVSLIVAALLAAAAQHFADHFSAGTIGLWQTINTLVSIALVTFLFGLIYKMLPDVKLAWGDVWLGAVLAALLFTLGKHLIGLYLGQSSVTSAYGAAGSLVVILLWVYYSSQILLFGAEFTRVYTLRRRSRVEPTRNAVFLTREELTRQGIPCRKDEGGS